MNVLEFTNQFTQLSFPKYGYIKLPKYIPTDDECKKLSVDRGIDSSKFLLKLIRKNFKQMVENGTIPKDKMTIYQDRINLEYKTYKDFYFIDYVLLIYSIIEFCKKNNIANSPARGSCAGSLILYVIGVTTINPIRYNLLFERFISAARTEIKEFDGESYLSSATLCDVDIDSDTNFKPLINKFLEDKLPNRTCKILNLLTLQTKIAIKEVGKAFANKPEEEMSSITSLVETLFGVNDTLKQTYEKNPVFKDWCDKNKKVYEISCKLEGLIKAKSVHASGIFISNELLSETLPIELSAEKQLVTSYDMSICSMLGIKVDNLGLKNLGAIHECLKLIGKKITDIDVNDPIIYKFLQTNSNFYGIFQCEEGLGKSTLLKIKPKTIDEIHLAIAMSRPGCFKLVDQYIKNRDNKDYIIHPSLKEILLPTHNIIVYQEELMRLCVVMAKFSPQESNGVRSAVGKKNKEKMLSYKDKFIKQSVENGYEKDFVEKTWQSFEDSGSYLFCQGHSAGYGNLTAITCYLKAKYPLEYFLSLLNYSKYEGDAISEISKIHKEMFNFGIKLLPPSLVLSEIGFSIEGKDIRFGLSSIKGISDKTMEKLNKFKRKFANKFEIFESAKAAGIGIGILSSLIHAGTLDQFGKNRSFLCYESQLWNTLTNNEKTLALKYARQFNYKIIPLVQAMTKELKNEKGKFLIKQSRFETIKKTMKRYKIIYEQNSISEDFCNWFYSNMLLGYCPDYKLINIFSKFIGSLRQISEIATELDKTPCYFIGKVQENPIMGKSKKGAKYAKYLIEDESGVMKVMIFNDKLEHCKEINIELPKEGSIVIVKGTKISDDTVFADTISTQQNKIFTKYSQIKNENE